MNSHLNRLYDFLQSTHHFSHHFMIFAMYSIIDLKKKILFIKKLILSVRFALEI